uniref:Uncharacterized protein n=1 Tax=Chromera velia CCMP2878 TaxID=1169474 RepID=A0A0G4FCD3_9ALVE|mmetsp:Transcript_54078/g.105816  ORF Transcript_54078/g.105816 Transcript_54078/m.105816 type:complete len:299 (+) Transcript_54078:137-1033(+)|eukprot:Cvel_16326.t1-p1 / transcript=Cvel_16326.t1 / gene=Cvel_16326 / organism=Chromera_velia_CCMP2878 / gene_product=hypothetical protein / transcript_product=hypothetical protein / location=Cvel_scaffold1253:8032-10125(-) / protein_length=298 / sequence_SO=supercontig / SO=protein_coding / is_pseudo=false
MKLATVALVFAGAQGAVDSVKKFGDLGSLSEKFDLDLGASKLNLDGFNGLDSGLFGEKGQKGKKCFTENCSITLDRLTWVGNLFDPEKGNNVLTAFHSVSSCGHKFKGAFLVPDVQDSEMVVEFSTPQPSIVRQTEKLPPSKNGNFSASLESFADEILGDTALAAWLVGTEGTLVEGSVTFGIVGVTESTFVLSGCKDPDAVAATVVCLGEESIGDSLFQINEAPPIVPVNSTFVVSPLPGEPESDQTKGKGKETDGLLQAKFTFNESPECDNNNFGVGIVISGCCGAAASYFVILQD